jgi:beta-lactamase class A
VPPTEEQNVKNHDRITRRRFLAGAGCCVAAGSISWAAERSPLADIEADLGGRIGVFALDTGSGAEMGYRADDRFALCSTFKWVLAAMILSRVDSDAISLEQRVAYGPEDLLDYSPVTREHVNEGSMDVAALCGAAVTWSDNAAANLLLELVGGPRGLTGFLRQCGDTVTRLDRNEPELNTNLPGDERDTTTPRAMTNTMQAILLGDILPLESRERLVDWMKQATTGLARLRAGLPEAWIAGDKTGTGANGAANDVAIAWPPGRKAILIASYLSGSSASADARNLAHARIGAAIAERMG